MQIGERRVTCSEIVERDADTQDLQGVQHRRRARDILDQHPLGYFELKPRRRDSAFMQDRSYQPLQIAPAKLNRRNIDCDLQLVIPRRGFAARLPQNPFSDLDDQIALFGNRDEFGRCHRAAPRVLPAHQRFKSNDLAVAVSLWLIFQKKLAVADRRPQLALQCVPVPQLLIHRRGEKANRAAAFVLGAIERGIGVCKQRPRILSVPGIDGDSDTEVEVETVAVDFDTPFERTSQPVRKQLGARRQRIFLGDRDEFVAADAREEHALRRGIEAPRCLAQRLVAHRMAEQIVDLLETIEIDAKDGEAATAPAGIVEDPQKLVIHRGAIGQVSQRVVARQMQDALLCAFAIRHVERHGNACIPVVVAQRPRLDRDVDYSSISRDMAASILRRLQALVLSELAMQSFRFFRNAQIFHRHRKHLLAAIAIMAARRCVHRQKFERVDIDHPHRERIFFEQKTERGFPAL